MSRECGFICPASTQCASYALAVKSEGSQIEGAMQAARHRRNQAISQLAGLSADIVLAEAAAAVELDTDEPSELLDGAYQDYRRIADHHAATEHELATARQHVDYLAEQKARHQRVDKTTVRNMAALRRMQRRCNGARLNWHGRWELAKAAIGWLQGTTPTEPRATREILLRAGYAACSSHDVRALAKEMPEIAVALPDAPTQPLELHP